MLRNPLYAGRMTWNRVSAIVDPGTGTDLAAKEPEAVIGTGTDLRLCLTIFGKRHSAACYRRRAASGAGDPRTVAPPAQHLLVGSDVRLLRPRIRPSARLSGLPGKARNGACATRGRAPPA